MTYKTKKQWAGNYTYRGYTFNKNGSKWDIFDNRSYRNTPNCSWKYAYSLEEARQKVDAMIESKG